MEKINIVIPMAGLGNRFREAGYNVPKPFIKFKNKMMIEHVLASFECIDKNLILVIQEKFLKEQKEELDNLSKIYSIKYVTVPKLTMGAAITALASHKAIDANYDIIFADSDNIFNPNDVKDFILYNRKNNLEGSILTVKSDKPCYSYVKIDNNNQFIETKEKVVISNHAISGMYYFKNKESFKDSVIDLVVENDLSAGEFYMSNVYNHLKKITNKIGIYEIAEFDCVGTPQQLETYIYRHSGGG